MQFKLLAATLLASSVAAEYANYMDCLVKKECKNEVACVNECFGTDRATSEQVSTFGHCNSGRCNKEGGVTKDTTDWTKYYECLPKCYNNVIGKPNGTQVDLSAKASDKKDGDKKEEDKKDGDKKEGDKKEGDKKDGDKKDDASNNSAAKPSTPANNGFKTVPSVFAAFILAALAL